jgi:transcriptional regulator with XRE-family HTH domain
MSLEAVMPVGRSMPGPLAKEIGAVLRRARRARGLALRNVSSLSSGTFKPSSLASYERGDRALSVERFLLLAELYDIPSARLMAQISRRAEGRPPIVVDVRTAHTIGGVEGAILAGFIHEVIALRRQSASSEEISLRDGDLEVLATASGRRAEQFMEAVELALRRH